MFPDSVDDLNNSCGLPHMTLPGSVLVVGAGCFGLSTAYHLLKTGVTKVTIVERSSAIPAPDAASNDINKSQLVFPDDEFLI
jgi:sarcosine oxidase/L-pipecolate oxidase